LLRDRLTHRERIALEAYRAAQVAMALIREAVEDCAPPGSVAREGYLTSEFTVQAEAASMLSLGGLAALRAAVIRISSTETLPTLAPLPGLHRYYVAGATAWGLLHNTGFQPSRQPTRNLAPEPTVTLESPFGNIPIFRIAQLDVDFRWYEQVMTGHAIFAWIAASVHCNLQRA
jgi:hypothetical protein